MKILALVFFIFLTITGCTPKEPSKLNEAILDKPKTQICNDPRPEVCTQQYDPVCGQLSQGGNQTFSNWCVACSDKSVKSYQPGECP